MSVTDDPGLEVPVNHQLRVMLPYYRLSPGFEQQTKLFPGARTVGIYADANPFQSTNFMCAQARDGT